MQIIRIGERPAPELHTLPEPVPREEAQALTRRLVQPCWDAAVAQKDQDAAYQALELLASADPVDALQKLETENLVIPGRVRRIKHEVAGALARSDPLGPRSWPNRLIRRFRVQRHSGGGRFAAEEARDRNSPCLRAAAIQAKAENSPTSAATVASSLNDPGARKRPRPWPPNISAPEMSPPAPLILRLPSGTNRPRDGPGHGQRTGRYQSGRSKPDLWERGVGLAEDNPAEAEPRPETVPEKEGQSWMHPALAWKLGKSDPARTRRLVEESQRHDDSPQTYLYLACGLRGREPAAAEASFWKGIKGIDRLLEEGAQYLARKIEGGPAALMPLVEQIDPTLVPEVFWRGLAGDLLSTLRVAGRLVVRGTGTSFWPGTTARPPRLSLKPIIADEGEAADPARSSEIASVSELDASGIPVPRSRSSSNCVQRTAGMRSPSFSSERLVGMTLGRPYGINGGSSGERVRLWETKNPLDRDIGRIPR